jgi:hypothetical protein
VFFSGKTEDFGRQTYFRRSIALRGKANRNFTAGVRQGATYKGKMMESLGPLDVIEIPLIFVVYGAWHSAF